jgi:hypothetical protein
MLKRIIFIIAAFIFIFQGTALFSQGSPRDEMARVEKELAREERELDLRRRQMEVRKERIGLEQHEMEMDIYEKVQEKKHSKMVQDLKQGKLPKMKPSHKMDPRARAIKERKDFWGLVFLCMLIIRVPLSIVVTKDVRQRQNMSSIWIFIVLIGGVPAAIAYALFCMSHKKA